MLNSLLEDGAYARMAYDNRFRSFCEKLEACLQSAIKSGDAVKSPVSIRNRVLFAYHVGAWFPLAQLPRIAALEYEGSREKLLQQAVWFALRGVGLTDKAITTYYNPEALALSLQEG